MMCKVCGRPEMFPSFWELFIGHFQSEWVCPICFKWATRILDNEERFLRLIRPLKIAMESK